MRTTSSIPDRRSARAADGNGPSRSVGILGWVLQAALGLAIAGGGLAKLAGDEAMVALFADIGAGQWLRLLVGVLEVAGGVGLLVPWLRVPAAIGLVVLLACAAVTNAVVLQVNPASPLAFAAVAVAILVLRRREVRRGAWMSGLRHPFRRQSVQVLRRSAPTGGARG